ncbi:hypothetical protein LINPERPRIM_LOCUS1966 [Linum perenne]
MVAIHQKKSMALSKLGNSQSVRKATKFIAPVLLSCVLLQHSSYLLPLIIDFSTSVIDKNYMFILCNGILVLIAKSAGLIGNGENVPEKGGEAAESKPEMDHKERAQEEAEEVIIEAEKEEDGKKDVILITEALKVDVNEQQKNGDADDVGVVEQQKNGDDEDVEEEGNGLLSAEELQEKCEEFIRKMKAGIKFEAQQQKNLIMVQ